MKMKKRKELSVVLTQNQKKIKSKNNKNSIMSSLIKSKPSCPVKVYFRNIKKSLDSIKKIKKIKEKEAQLIHLKLNKKGKG